jgi:Secretion system C-terminal sorting domain/Fibronectin type III domain
MLFIKNSFFKLKYYIFVKILNKKTMKKLLLLMSLLLMVLTTQAQLTCATATAITANGTYTCPAITGTYLVNCFTNTTTAVPAGGPMKAIWYKYTATANGSVEVSSDLPINVAPNSDDTRLSITTGTCGALVCTTSSDDINPAATGGNYLSKATFAVTSGTTYYISWDNNWSGLGFDFSLNYSSCNSVVTTYLASAITANSATLNWLPAVGSPASYQVEYGVTGFVQGTGTIVPSTTVSATLCTANLTGLVNNAIYDYYVRSVCGTSSFSPWTTVRTIALAQLLPYVTNFDTNNSRAGWSRFGTATNFNNLAGNAQSGTIYGFFDSSTTVVSNSRLFTPPIELASGQSVTVSFWLKNSAASTRSFRVTAGTDTTISSQTNVLWTNTAINNTSYVQYTTPVFIAPAAGNYFFSFNDVTPIQTAVSTLFFDTLSITASPLANDTFLNNSFSISPNPADKFITVSNTDNINISEINITDLNGRIVKSQKVSNVSNIEINVADLTTGMYLMNINSDKGIVTKKIMKN